TAFSVLGSFFIYHFVYYDGSLSKRIIVIALCGIIVAMSDIFSLMTFNKYRLGYPQASLAFETYWTLMGVGSKVICFMIINTIYRVVQYKKQGFKPVELILHASPIITLYIIELLMQSMIGTPYLQVSNAFTAVLTSMGLLFTNVFTWSVFDALIRNEREKQFYLMCQESVKQQYEFYRNQEAKEESTRRIWHDIHNHLQCVHELIRQGHSAEAHDYLVSLEKDISMLRGEIRTGHLIVDTILADKYGAALAYQIKMAIKVNGNLLNAIQDMDLCVIYSNLIDNAIEACQKNSLDEREILITTKKANHYTLIEIINSRSGDLIE
ncbi:MAG: GHKL domain-containing protein, partial [Niameybacter sp.]